MTERNFQNKFSKDMDGFWKTEGYNYIVEIENGNPIIYEYTRISCFKIDGFMGYLDPTSPAFKASVSNGDKLTFEMISSTFFISSKKIAHLPELPEEGISEETNDPEKNFEVYWHTFNDLYPFFEKRGINWKDHYDKFRPRVHSRSSDDDLANIMRKMVFPIGDAHIFLKRLKTDTFDIFVVFPEWIRGSIANALKTIEENAILGKWKGAQGKVAEVLNGTFKDFLSVIKKKYLKGKFKAECNGMIFYGKINESIGYIYLARVFNFASDVKHDTFKELEVLNETFDKIIQDFKDIQVVILDDRFCLGGDDSIGLAIAERFADKRRIVLSKQAKGAEGFSPLHEFHVNPVGKKTFSDKKIIVLTSGITISGGENLAIMMRALPNTTFIGEPGPGLLSDTILRHLPNGWQLFLPMEVFYSYDGKAYEVVKFPVDIKIPLNKNGFKKGKDDILDKAIEIARGI